MRQEGWWTAWTATFAAVVSASCLAAYALAEVSSDWMEDLYDRSLAELLHGEVGIFADALATEPLETPQASGASACHDGLAVRLVLLTMDAGLHSAALFDPNDQLVCRAGADLWLSTPLDGEFVRRARDTSGVVTIPRNEDGTNLLLAYAPVRDHPGFVLGVARSGVTLTAVDDLETLLLYAGVAVGVVGAALGLILGTALTQPLSRLATQVANAAPGAAEEAIAVQGPREVRKVARSVRHLLSAIRDRDAALQVAHADRLAEVTTLAATVAHEVRNPANALGIILRGVRTAETAERREQLVIRGESCVAEIEGIVERFLDLSRPFIPHLASCDLVDVCHAATAELPPSIRATVCGDGAVVVRTDGELVGQVLRNLLRNAVEAGARNVLLRVDGGSILISDDGPGIPPEDAARVFEWFHTRRERGHGLGLPLSRRICHALGGDVALVSIAPATFRVTIRGAAL